MSNCLTCKHNDRRAKMCTLQDVHTDLGHVLNCAMWTPMDEAVIKQLKDENARLLNDNARLQEVVTDDELHMRKVLEENAELRERVCNLFNAVFAKNNELIDLLCENEKLRELVTDYDKMLGLALADYRGFDAPLSDATHIALRTRMYNLGIEVAE